MKSFYKNNFWNITLTLYEETECFKNCWLKRQTSSFLNFCAFVILFCTF